MLLAGAGERERPRAAYGQAVAAYQDVGAEWEIARTDARLRPFGLRRCAAGGGRRPSTGWTALSRPGRPGRPASVDSRRPAAAGEVQDGSAWVGCSWARSWRRA